MHFPRSHFPRRTIIASRFFSAGLATPHSLPDGCLHDGAFGADALSLRQGVAGVGSTNTASLASTCHARLVWIMLSTTALKCYSRQVMVVAFNKCNLIGV